MSALARTVTDVEPIWREFHQLVNMTTPELRQWLAASEDVFNQQLPGVPREVPEGDLESIGWQIVNILGKRRTDLTDEDVTVMREVISIVREKLDNPPGEGVMDDEWRRDLMLVGHDPLRPGRGAQE